MVSVPVSGSSDLGSSLGRVPCVVCLGKTNFNHGQRFYLLTFIERKVLAIQPFSSQKEKFGRSPGSNHSKKTA